MREEVLSMFEMCNPSCNNKFKALGYSQTSGSVIEEFTDDAAASVQASEYYEYRSDALLSDSELCQGICSLPVFHATASLWGRVRDETRGSRELSCVLHVMKERLMTLLDRTGDDRRGRFMLRLFDLSVEGRRITGQIIKALPAGSSVPLAIMLFDNLEFLVKRGTADGQGYFYATATEDLTQPIGFADAAQATLGCTIEEDAQLLAVHNEFEAMWNAALRDRTANFKHNRSTLAFPFYGWSAQLSVQKAMFV